jgi:hypothetical protein
MPSGRPPHRRPKPLQSKRWRIASADHEAINAALRAHRAASYRNALRIVCCLWNQAATACEGNHLPLV